MHSSELQRLARNSLFVGPCRSWYFPGQYVPPSKGPARHGSSQAVTGFYLISFWYKREEAQQRFTFYWCSVLIASAFGGLLASAIAKMDGIGGYSNWRWIFILEGILTILIGIAAFFFVADFPEEATWLTEDERTWVVARTGRDQEPPGKIVAQDILHFFSELKHILGGIIYFGELLNILLLDNADRCQRSHCRSNLQ